MYTHVYTYVYVHVYIYVCVYVYISIAIICEKRTIARKLLSLHLENTEYIIPQKRCKTGTHSVPNKFGTV